MKISIIGAGNVGGLTAMRLSQEGIADIFLVDILPGLAQGKALDLDDAKALVKINYHIHGTSDINAVKDSDIIVITAGLARKPGMRREDLANKNALIIKDICYQIKNLALRAIVIVVTNPLDLMTYLCFKQLGSGRNKVLGMGSSLDALRFANLIASELHISPLDVEACVIGIHGEDMLVLPRFTNIKGVALDEFLKEAKIQELVKKTVERGQEIVSLLGSGSAYFAPSAAVANIIKAMVKDEKRTLAVSTYLNGEYGIRDACLGIPCRLGKTGIEEIIELDLNQQEKEKLLKSATELKAQYKNLTV